MSFGLFFLASFTWAGRLFGILWMGAPILAWYISTENKEEIEIAESERRYLKETAKRTWEFFEDHITEKNNYLITDNYQEDRVEKIVSRTSSTNIGLELLAIISAYDLGFINFKKTVDYLNKVLVTVAGLSKWNGH